MMVAGIRYELPSAYRTLLQPTVRVARWDLSSIDLVDPRRGTHPATLLPIDKQRNADRHRRALTDAMAASTGPRCRAQRPRACRPCCASSWPSMPPQGLLPAYLPHDPTMNRPTDDEETES